MTRTQFQQFYPTNYVALINVLYGKESDADAAVARVANWVRSNCQCLRPATLAQAPAAINASADALAHLMEIIGPSIQSGDFDHVIGALL